MWNEYSLAVKITFISFYTVALAMLNSEYVVQVNKHVYTLVTKQQNLYLIQFKSFKTKKNIKTSFADNTRQFRQIYII